MIQQLLMLLLSAASRKWVELDGILSQRVAPGRVGVALEQEHLLASTLLALCLNWMGLDGIRLEAIRANSIATSSLKGISTYCPSQNKFYPQRDPSWRIYWPLSGTHWLLPLLLIVVDCSAWRFKDVPCPSTGWTTAPL